MADRKTVAGALNVVKKLLAEEPAAETLLTAADRAAAGRKAAELIKSQPPTKASEALGQLMERGMKRVTTTQADRTRVGGGNIGGANFPAISEADPAYKGNVWGVMDEGTASRLKNLATPDTAWTTMLGSANQLKTNPVVFDKLKRQFMEAMKQGKLSPELEAKINHNLALNFGEGASIRDPGIWKQADTFEKRAALADLMMGQGIPPKKGGVALGGEKSGKGVIFKPTDTLIKETEPTLLHPEYGGDIDTFAAGPRLFRLEKESVNRPDLHPGFPTLLKGEDLGYNMEPVPTEIFLPTWHKEFREKKPERFQGPWAQDIIERRKSKDYKMKGAEGPGYYDLALGLEGEGLPSQVLNDEYIRHLLREGFKEGGEATKEPSALDKIQAKIKATIHEHHMAAGGGAFKTMSFQKGGKASTAKAAMDVGKRLFSQDVLPAAEREANLAKMLEGSKVKDRLYHGTTEDIQKFDPSKAGAKTKNLTTALGTFLSNNPQEASRYAKDWGAQGGNVMPVFAQVTNPYQMPYKEFEGLAMGDWNRMMKDPSFDPNAVVKWNDIEGAKRAAAAVNKHQPDALQDVLNRRDELISQGHDAVIVNIGGNKEVIVFDPAKIKSAIGNRGTYDVKDADITKAKGGLLHMADAGRVVKGARKALNKLFDDAPQADALKLAQERAALPPAQGGLGLPKSNTPKQRANAMGIKTDAYHGSKQDITGAFKPGYDDNLAFVTKSPEFANKWIGKGKHTERTGDKAKQEIKSADDMYRDIRSRNVNYDDELERLKGDEFNAEYDRRSAIARAEAESEFGPRGSPSGIHSTVYPLRVEANRTFNPETDMDVMDGFFKKNDIPKNLQDLYAGGNYMMYETKPVVEYLKSKGYDSMRLRESTGDDYPTIAVFNPETTRSRFAAFDPFRKDAATAAAMGVAAPDLLAKEQDKAHGGLTRAFAGGGITTGAGSFSPEDVGMTAAEMNAPAIPAYVKQNASKLMDEGRAQLEKEYSQLKTPQGRADFIKRLGTALVGSPHDMLHMGLELGDYVQTKIPGMSKPESVMLPSDTKDRVPKVSLADLHTTKEGDVYGGSSGFNTELKRLKFLGENEFPMMELPTMLFGPAVASKAGRGLKALASKAK